MKCALCKNGESEPGTATVTLNRGETTVVIKGVPAEVCDNCGEYYLDEDTTRRVMELARRVVQHGAEVEIITYAA